jgi:hypothetical protein
VLDTKQELSLEHLLDCHKEHNHVHRIVLSSFIGRMFLHFLILTIPDLGVHRVRWSELYLVVFAAISPESVGYELMLVGQSVGKCKQISFLLHEISACSFALISCFTVYANAAVESPDLKLKKGYVTLW